ncbi:MAG: glycosyltransferase family 2 protein [Thiobacillus sp.]
MNTKYPLISVALATYNGEKYLVEMLDSIEGQDHPHLELVIADDASTDSTPRLLHERDWQRSCNRLETSDRLGVIGNFGRAIAACTGDYVAFADQDDIWRPDKLSRMLARMQMLEQQCGKDTPLLVFSDLALVDEHRAPLADSFFTHAKKSPHCTKLRDFLVSNHVPGCAMLVNHALIQRAMPVPQTFHMHDWWFIMVAAAFGAIDYIDEPLIQYRQHTSNTVGVRRRHGLAQRLRNAMQADAWRRYLFPPAERVQRTMQNIALFEDRYRNDLPLAARDTLRALRACEQSWWRCLRFFAHSKTGESVLFSLLTLRAIASFPTATKLAQD